jgi:hypothetical protein
MLNVWYNTNETVRPFTAETVEAIRKLAETGLIETT